MSAEAFHGLLARYQAGGPPLDTTPTSVRIAALAFAVTTPSPGGDTLTLDLLKAIAGNLA